MQQRLPLPHALETFERCKLDWSELEAHAAQRQLHRDLLALRRTEPAFTGQNRVDGAVLAPAAFVLRFPGEVPSDERLLIVNLGADLTEGAFAEPLLAPPAGHVWSTQWSSEHPDYGGGGIAEVATDEGWRIAGQAAAVLAPVEVSDARD